MEFDEGQNLMQSELYAALARISELEDENADLRRALESEMRLRALAGPAHMTRDLIMLDLADRNA